MDTTNYIRNMEYEKRLAIASFASRIIYADDAVDENEISAFRALFSILDLDEETDMKTIKEIDYSNILKDFDHFEVITLGASLGIIAMADGTISPQETAYMEQVLNKSGLGPDLIPEFIKSFTQE